MNTSKSVYIFISLFNANLLLRLLIPALPFINHAKYFNFLQFFIKHLSDKPTITYILLFKLAKCNTIDLFYLLLFPVVPVLVRENFLTVALSLLIQCIVVLDLADLRDNFYCLNYFYSIFYNC